jgi:hypothetical protein
LIDPPFFHEPSGTIRFFTEIDGQVVGASITPQTLHHRFRPDGIGEDPMETYRANHVPIAAAVRRRVAAGSLAPVMLREHDLRTDA